MFSFFRKKKKLTGIRKIADRIARKNQLSEHEEYITLLHMTMSKHGLIMSTRLDHLEDVGTVLEVLTGVFNNPQDLNDLARRSLAIKLKCGFRNKSATIYDLIAFLSGLSEERVIEIVARISNDFYVAVIKTIFGVMIHDTSVKSHWAIDAGGNGEHPVYFTRFTPEELSNIFDDRSHQWTKMNIPTALIFRLSGDLGYYSPAQPSNAKTLTKEV